MIERDLDREDAQNQALQFQKNISEVIIFSDTKYIPCYDSESAISIPKTPTTTAKRSSAASVNASKGHNNNNNKNNSNKVKTTTTTTMPTIITTTTTNQKEQTPSSSSSSLLGHCTPPRSPTSNRKKVWFSDKKKLFSVGWWWLLWRNGEIINFLLIYRHFFRFRFSFFFFDFSEVLKRLFIYIVFVVYIAKRLTSVLHGLIRCDWVAVLLVFFFS